MILSVPVQGGFCNANFTNYNNIPVKQNIKSYKEQNNMKFCSYPSNYYLGNVSFGRTKKLSNEEIIEKIGKDNFPSPVIADKFESEKDKSLFEVHNEYYENLKNCKTLEEAKKKYPEFSEVIDAKDIDTDKFQAHSIFRRIKKGEIQGLSMDNLTLELLKKQYAELKSPRKAENYFNIMQRTVYGMFDELNIKKPNINYVRAVNFSNPDFIKKQSDITQEMWNNDDGTRREIAAKLASTVLQSDEVRNKVKEFVSTPEFKNKMSELKKSEWRMDDGTKREAARLMASTVLQTHEVIEKRNEKLQSPEYREARRLAYQRHPEVIKVMKEIAATIPNLGNIIAHVKDGTANEYEKNMYYIYHKMCENAMPGHKAIIGQEWHNILVERGLIKE